jgi:hypothetical protein
MNNPRNNNGKKILITNGFHNIQIINPRVNEIKGKPIAISPTHLLFSLLAYNLLKLRYK